MLAFSNSETLQPASRPAYFIAGVLVCVLTCFTHHMPPAGQNEQVRIALGQPPIRGRGLRVLAMDGGGMKVCGTVLSRPLTSQCLLLSQATLGQ